MINDKLAHLAVDEKIREAGLKAIRLENFREVIDLIRSNGNGATLLDVGAAHGWFLEEAVRHFDALGLEPDLAVGEKTVSRGLPVRIGYFPDALTPAERFDVIVFNDVIEHIPHIGSALRASADRLLDNGLLVLSLPNSAGLFYRLARGFARLGWTGPFARLWQKDLPSPHVHFFNKDNLTALVEKSGFQLMSQIELPSVRVKGLAARLRCANPRLVSFLIQYGGTLALFPLTKLFPSDAIVCAYRKRHRPD
ncbi:class I SAM-dependent methyltransferase [Ralstonia sp. 25mfcol4.1]|uniref:class I SAM-dependent methyltransferase n=1 Tax=Ralstonia sp. 25mfcol4.1 TaxID=1761899 RepID=UPI0020C8F48C|nr:class I SAM-dependent methyltransferase [Ralstonia sp. 25mfcol4.1]